MTLVRVANRKGWLHADKKSLEKFPLNFPSLAGFFHKRKISRICSVRCNLPPIL